MSPRNPLNRNCVCFLTKNDKKERAIMCNGWNVCLGFNLFSISLFHVYSQTKSASFLLSGLKHPTDCNRALGRAQMTDIFIS